MSTRKPHNTPTNARAEKGEVLVDGPGGYAASLTPDAAATSAEHISNAAKEAAQQREAKRDRSKKTD